MICLEKCDGTIDELFENGEINEKKWFSSIITNNYDLITLSKDFILLIMIYTPIILFTN